MELSFYDLSNDLRLLHKYDILEVNDYDELFEEVFIRYLCLNKKLYSHIYIGIYSENDCLDKFIRIYIGKIDEYEIDKDLIQMIIDKLDVKKFMVIYNKNESKINKMDRLLREAFYLIAVFDYIKFDDLYICLNNEIMKCPKASEVDTIYFK